MHFEKILSLDLDLEKLYLEWLNATGIAFSTKNTYIRTAVNQSTFESSNRQVFIGGNTTVYDINSYSASTILNCFKNTYTEEVVNTVENIFNKKGLRLTRIKYAALKPNSEIKTHVDEGYKDRYHLTVKTNNHCFITIDNIDYSIHEPSTMYRMFSAVPHSVRNLGDEIRILLSFDVASLDT